MKQICDGYNPHVLMGNWYEQSYAVSQPARDQPTKVARTKQVDIGFIDNKGKLRQLNTISRLQPWNTSNLVTTDEFSYQKLKPLTVMREGFDLKTTQNYHQTYKAQPFSKQNNVNVDKKSYMRVDKFQKSHRLFNEKNVNELLNQRQSDETSFKTVLKPNIHTNHKEFLQSIYQMQISQPAQWNMTCTKQAWQTKQSQQSKQSNEETKQSLPRDFRRIRSQITLKTTKNFPFTCK